MDVPNYLAIDMFDLRSEEPVVTAGGSLWGVTAGALVSQWEFTVTLPGFHQSLKEEPFHRSHSEGLSSPLISHQPLQFMLLFMTVETHEALTLMSYL